MLVRGKQVSIPADAGEQTRLTDSSSWSKGDQTEETVTGSFAPENVPDLSSAWAASEMENNANIRQASECSYFVEVPEVITYASEYSVSAIQVGQYVDIGDFPQTYDNVGEMAPLTVGDDVTSDFTEAQCNARDEEESIYEHKLLFPGDSQSSDYMYFVHQPAFEQVFTESQISAFIDPEDGLPYPALHVTEDGLITVILRKGVFLEMTPEKAVRLVNHEKKLVVALTDNGCRACVIHPGAKICQSETTVNAELYFGRKAKMTTEMIMFGNKLKTYSFDYNCVTEIFGTPSFRDLSQDESVFYLETDSGFFNNEALARCHDIITRAYFNKHQSSGSKVVINGVKIIQNDSCDVTVYVGPIKYMKMNPIKSVLRLKSQFVEIDIEANWNIKIKRGSHTLNVSHLGFVVSNSKIKASLDSKNKFQAFSLPDHRCLMLGQRLLKPGPGVGRQARHPTGCCSTEPEGDHDRDRKRADQGQQNK